MLRARTQSSRLDARRYRFSVGCGGFQDGFGGVTVERRGAFNGSVAANQGVRKGVAMDIVRFYRTVSVRFLLRIVSGGLRFPVDAVGFGGRYAVARGVRRASG